MKTSNAVVLSLLTFTALPALAVPGELQIPLTGAQVLFQVFDNPGGGIPGGVPPLDLRNVRSSEPFIDATVGGMQIRYGDIERAIEDAIRGAPPHQGEAIDIIGDYPDRIHCRLFYNIYPDVTFLTQPQTLNITENRPGHLSASFDTMVQVRIRVEANIFNIPVIGSDHLEADIEILLGAHVALTDVGVWPPNTNDLFNSGNPPTINTNHVTITLQQLGGNVELDGLQEPIILSSFVIGTAGILAAPATFGLSAIFTVLAPLIAALAPEVEETVEDLVTGFLTQGISAGITELDAQLRDVIAGAGNQINAANAISSMGPSLFGAANAFNTWMQSQFGTSFTADTRIDNSVVGVGLSIDRSPSAATGPNTVQGRIRFPRYRCDYAQADYIESTTSCDGHNAYSSDIYSIEPILTGVNGDLVGRNCATFFSTSFYTRNYLGSSWNPPLGATPSWQTLTPAVTGTNVQLVTEGGQTFYACDFTLGSVPSNIILDFGAKSGSALAGRIVPTRSGPSLPAELVVDPAEYLGRVHMVVRSTPGGQVTLDERGSPVAGRSMIGSAGPQPSTLAVDCPSYALPLNGGNAGSCSNPGTWQSPCGDCY